MKRTGKLKLKRIRILKTCVLFSLERGQKYISFISKLPCFVITVYDIFHQILSKSKNNSTPASIKQKEMYLSYIQPLFSLHFIFTYVLFFRQHLKTALQGIWVRRLGVNFEAGAGCQKS